MKLPSTLVCSMLVLSGCGLTDTEWGDGLSGDAEGGCSSGAGGHSAADSADSAAAGSSGVDEGGSGEGGSDDGVEPLPSRCEIGEGLMLCEHQTAEVKTGFTGLVTREVHWQVPRGEPPENGWPAALLFQGSIFTAETFWTVLDVDTLGYWNQGMLTKTLLDSGFAVITPEAHFGGLTAWETNVPPMSLYWESSADHQFMLDIFAKIDEGCFGAIDTDRLYAAGISSGGYMTSRMDEAYRGRFVALAIQSASWATCSGPLCAVPDDLDAEHLPTLFLHGGEDLIVPMSTMEDYRDALDALGVPTQTVIDPEAGHAWIDDAPVAIVDWFTVH